MATLAELLSGAFGGGVSTVRMASPSAVGPNILGISAVTEFDYYDRMFFFNNASLAGRTLEFFQQGIGDSYTPLGGTATENITKKLTDTNADLKGQTAYHLRIHGISLELGTIRGIDGAGVNSLAQWSTAFQVLLEDAAIEFLVNDTVYDRFKPKHAPAGGGAFGFGTGGVVAAAGAVAAQSVMANGNPIATNYKNYSAAPLYVPMNNRVKVRLTFGDNIIPANFAYKPAPAGASTAELFWSVRLIGTRANSVQ